MVTVKFSRIIRPRQPPWETGGSNLWVSGRSSMERCRNQQKKTRDKHYSHAILGGWWRRRCRCRCSRRSNRRAGSQAIAGMLYPDDQTSSEAEVDDKYAGNCVSKIYAVFGNSTASAAIRSTKREECCCSLSDGWNKILPSEPEVTDGIASWNQYLRTIIGTGRFRRIDRIAIGEGPSQNNYKIHPVVQAGGDITLSGSYTLSQNYNCNHFQLIKGMAPSIGAHEPRSDYRLWYFRLIIQMTIVSNGGLVVQWAFYG